MSFEIASNFRLASAENNSGESGTHKAVRLPMGQNVIRFSILGRAEGLE